MERINCSICNETPLVSLYVFPNMPIQLSCVDTPVTTQKQHLKFSQCPRCNTIQLSQLVPLDILYANSHNTISVGNTWKKYFELFTNILTSEIQGQTVLEIGDPSAKLANSLDGYHEWTIVEPNPNHDIVLNPRISFVKSFFDSMFHLDTPVDIIVHSHLFEHMYDFSAFLTKCHQLLRENGKMIFGIPNMEHIAKHNLCPCLGIFFEHTVYLSKESVTYLLHKHGFNIDHVYEYESHSYIFHTTKSIPKYVEPPSFPNMYNVFLSSIESSKLFVDMCLVYMDMHPSKTYFVFGASYNTQYLLSIVPELAKRINCILDNSVDKHNKYLFGYELLISPPTVICEVDEPVVILKNGYYVNEITSQLKHLNNNCIILQ